MDGLLADTVIARGVQTMARPGTLALSAATRRLVEPVFQLRSLGHPTLKGVAGPLELFEALEDAAPLAAVTESRRAPPLIGRDLELAHLLARWADARADPVRVPRVP